MTPTKKGNNSKIKLPKEREPNERVLEFREKRRLTQEQLAERVGVSSKYISMLETGVRKISDELANRMAEVLVCNPKYLTYESTNKYKTYENTPISELLHSPSDRSYLLYLLSKHNISLWVIDTSDEKDIKKEISLGQIENISLDSIFCRYKINNIEYDGIITDVTIDSSKITYGEFCYIIKDIENYIEYRMISIKEQLGMYDKYVTQRNIETTDAIHLKELSSMIPNEIFYK